MSSNKPKAFLRLKIVKSLGKRLSRGVGDGGLCGNWWRNRKGKPWGGGGGG